MARQPFSRSHGLLGPVLLGAVVVVAGCSAATPGAAGAQPSGSATPGSIAPSPPASGAQPSAPAVHLDLQASGSVVTVQVGQQIVISLPTGWTAPVPRSPASDLTPALVPLRTDAATGYPEPGPAGATFTATRAGSAVISARTDAACLHQTPVCALPQQAFEVVVNVKPVPGHGAGPVPRAS